MKWSSIVADAIFFFPAPLLVVGWARWVPATEPRGWRRNVIAVGLGSASLSCLCLYGVVLYVQKAHIGYWNEYMLASEWGVFNWPAALVAAVLGLLGKGASRLLLVFAAAVLVLLWTAQFVH